MIEQTVEYLKRALGLEVVVAPYAGGGIPAFLGWSYEFYSGDLGQMSCLFALGRPGEHITPAVIATNMRSLREISGLIAVYVGEGVAGYDRQRLIASGTPFIVPHRQLYLPFIGLLALEFGSKKQRSFDSLGVAAQLLALKWLNGAAEGYSIAGAMEVTGYSKPSVLRAFDELEYFYVARRQGSAHHLHFLAGQAVQWKDLLGKMKNPRMRVVGLEAIPQGLSVVPAGLEALSLRSALNPSEQREVAAFHTDYSRLRQREIPVADAPVKLELWRYRPIVMADGAVDPFSLYLTLKDHGDERVQKCLDEMMEAL